MSESADALQGLQDDVPPFRSPGIKELISQSLELDADEVFSELDLEPLASASVAQVQFTGSIRDYYVNPATISGTEDVAENRLTIVIQVDYIDTVEPDNSFSQTFSDGENFDATANLIDVEDDLIDVITERIAESIFNRAFVNW